MPIPKLSELDFSKVKVEESDRVGLANTGRQAIVNMIRRHNKLLQTAIIAALWVIEIEHEPLRAYQGDNARMQRLDKTHKELETALAVFRKE